MHYHTHTHNGLHASSHSGYSVPAKGDFSRLSFSLMMNISSDCWRAERRKKEKNSGEDKRRRVAEKEERQEMNCVRWRRERKCRENIKSNNIPIKQTPDSSVERKIWGDGVMWGQSLLSTLLSSQLYWWTQFLQREQGSTAHPLPRFSASLLGCDSPPPSPWIPTPIPWIGNELWPPNISNTLTCSWGSSAVSWI